MASGGAPGYVATDWPLKMRSCGAVAKPKPKLRQQKRRTLTPQKFT
ncbi:hypothetical protein RNAN_3776 [Rheinheimera nanhaiensis E407-8]|uniref:Uncharacterized protein n=1 Tax=Rheinheimera nanhaiensis E407-8 TaxID=562729 RepID=I1E371_9GAMM|nr:hypothetical protein RNAN_3776 [Rheinheimera nanhaiensis E407-8]